MNPRALALIAASAALIAVAGCSSAGPKTTSTQTHGAVAATTGADGVQQVTIKATNMFRFDPPTVTAHPGTLKVTLVDVGSYPHNLAVAALHTTSSTVTGSPGDTTTTLTLRFPRPGRYRFVCTFHSSAGMRGLFIIR